MDLSRRRAGAEAGVGGALPPDPDEVLLLVVDEAAPVEGAAGGLVSARHRLADRAAQVLVDPPRGGAGAALVDELNASVRMVPGLEQVFADAAGVVAAWPDGSVRVARGGGGVVVRVHGEDWSLVFRVGGRVLVALDSVPGTLWRVDRDPDWAVEVSGMVEGVLRELDRRAPGGDRYPGVS